MYSLAHFPAIFRTWPMSARKHHILDYLRPLFISDVIVSRKLIWFSPPFIYYNKIHSILSTFRLLQEKSFDSLHLSFTKRKSIRFSSICHLLQKNPFDSLWSFIYYKKIHSILFDLSITTCQRTCFNCTSGIFIG